MKINFGANFLVFLLFFGIAAIEAVRTKDWLKVILWAALAFLFLFADNQKKQRKNKK